jgi:hypothetical protein
MNNKKKIDILCTSYIITHLPLVMDKTSSPARDDFCGRSRRKPIRKDLMFIRVQLPLPSDLARFNYPKNLLESMPISAYGLNGNVRPITILSRTNKRMLIPALFLIDEQGRSIITILFEDVFFAGVNINNKYRQDICIHQFDEQKFTITEETRDAYSYIFTKANELMKIT